MKNFLQQFNKRGRAVIVVPVQVIDKENITMTGTYERFIEKTS